LKLKKERGKNPDVKPPAVLFAMLTADYRVDFPGFPNHLSSVALSQLCT